MDYMQMAILLLGFAGACMGWFARQLWGAVQSLKEDVNNLRVMIGTDYVRYDRLADAVKPIMDSLHEIKETLKSKVDK